jgi:uncharacterized protein (TIGR02145 family)
MKKKFNLLIFQIIILGVLLIQTSSCKKDKDSNGPVPILTTAAVTNISQSEATSGGNITSDGGTTVLVRGVCWSTGITPTIADSKTNDGTGAGSFTSAISGLNYNTKYYVRAYATNASGTGYGSTMSFTTLPAVLDIDGNVYHTIIIGTQEWLLENLKVSHYRNGDPIPNISDSVDWSILSTGAYCDFKNIAGNSSTYGKLYNWYAVNDSRNIAPTGWHIPSDAEWTVLTTYLGGESVTGGKLREKGNTHWTSVNNADNSSGFTALPGGYRHFDGGYWYLGTNALWWTSTEYNTTNSYARFVSNTDLVTRFFRVKASGFSVRCLKD